jgi:S-formylglutathione hydrolase FrmB
MILVMPDCNKWPYKKHPGKKNLYRYLFRYSRISREHEIEYSVSELMDMIDTTYVVSSYCAIAGLSDGARIAANVANKRPDCIRTVGLFSPVLHKDQLPKDSTLTYYIYVGTKDIFGSSGKRFHKRMKKNDYPHQFIKLQGSHNWRMWRQCFSDFIEKL